MTRPGAIGIRRKLARQAVAQSSGSTSLSAITSASGTFPYDGEQQRATVGLEARQSIWSGGSLTAQRDQARICCSHF
jgi:hypothetical protein